MTNRAYRALERFGSDASMTEAEFYAYKYDMAYSTQSAVARTIACILATPPDDPEVQEALDRLATWDLHATPDNRGAALVVLWLQPFGERLLEEEIPDEELYAHLLDAVRFLRAHYGRLDPRWEEVNHLKRGDLDIGLGGAPDVLHAVYRHLPTMGICMAVPEIRTFRLPRGKQMARSIRRASISTGQLPRVRIRRTTPTRHCSSRGTR